MGDSKKILVDPKEIQRLIDENERLFNENERLKASCDQKTRLHLRFVAVFTKVVDDYKSHIGSLKAENKKLLRKLKWN